MYKVLDRKEYGTMTAEDKISELRKWVTEQLDNHKAVLRSITGIIPVANKDFNTVISVDLRDLPTMMNDFDEDSVAYAVLKYRIENAIDDCDDIILDSDAIGRIVMGILPNCDSEEDIRTILAHRSFSDDMITLCSIFCFDDLRESFTIWRP